MVVKVKATAAAAPTTPATPVNVSPITVPTLTVDMRPLASLKAYANNPRKNDAQVPKMVELLKAYGFRVPILVRGDRIVDGHLRVKAATALGMPVVPVIDVGSISEAEERALRIALNKSVEWADWDTDLLGKEMKEIAAAGLNLSLTGFGANEVAKLVKTLGNEPLDLGLPKVNKTKLADAGTPADPNYVSVTFHMSAESRDKVMQGLNAYRGKHGYANVSMALVGLIESLG